MRLGALIASVLLALVSGCQAAASPTATPLPPTATVPSTGLSGTVEYLGNAQGNILILALDHIAEQDENPNPVAIDTFNGASGEFFWELPAGTYYITAFFTIGRDPQGPPQPNEPLVSCEPVQLNANEVVDLYVPLTDDDAGGTSLSCLVGN